MEAFPAVGNQVQNKSETTSVTLSMRRSRAKKIVQKMQAPPATGKQVQNKLENSVIPRYLEQRRKKIREMEAPPATGKQVQNNFWCEET